MATRAAFFCFERSAAVGADGGDGLQDAGEGGGLRAGDGRVRWDINRSHCAFGRITRRVRQNLADILDITRSAQILACHIPHCQWKADLP